MSDMMAFSNMTTFNGRNWGIWKLKMEDVLYLNDLHDPIDGDGKKPSNVDEGKWNKMDKKAIALPIS